MRWVLLLLLFAPCALPFPRRAVTSGRTREGPLWAVVQRPSGGIPPDALVTQSVDLPTWKEERRRLLSLGSDPTFPRGFAKYLRSVNLGDKGSFHCFEASGEVLEDFGWSEEIGSEEERLDMICDALEAVAYLHDQGLPHLSLSGKTTYIRRNQEDNRNSIKIVGIGAGPQLIAASRPFQLAEGAWAYQPPEVLQSAVIQSNLAALMAMDSWALGVLVATLSANEVDSPFKIRPDSQRLPLLFSDQSATFNKIKTVLKSPGEFLRTIDKKGNGFLFRHPWLLQLISSLLIMDPRDRMSASEAYDIAVKSRAFETMQTDPVVVTSPAGPDIQAMNGVEGPVSSILTTPEPDMKGNVQLNAVESGQVVAPAPGVDVKGADTSGTVELKQFAPSMTTDKASGEPFRSLEAILNIAEGGLCQVLVEDRGEIWREAGMRNYGEIIGFRNRSDGDRWDVFMPGIGEETELPPGTKARIARVLGIVLVKGGNHKIAVQLEGYRVLGRKPVREDVKRFMDGYVQLHPNTYRKRVKYLSVERL